MNAAADYPPPGTPFTPSPEQWARWQKADIETAKFYVRLWRVVYDTTDEQGRKIIGMPLSRRLALKQQAIDYLETVKKTHPAAYVSHATIFFSKNLPSDVEERRDLLLEMGLDPESVYVDGVMQPPYRLCRPEECHVLMDSSCYFGWGDGEPIEIAIRKDATDAQLLQMHERYGVPLAKMKEFREMHALPRDDAFFARTLAAQEGELHG